MNISISELTSIQLLPIAFSVSDLSSALGTSTTFVYTLLHKKGLPYIDLAGRIVIFKEHLIEWADKKKFTPIYRVEAIKSLPDSFSPRTFMKTFSISQAKCYTLTALDNFPIAVLEGRIFICKIGFLEWLDENNLIVNI